MFNSYGSLWFPLWRNRLPLTVIKACISFSLTSPCCLTRAVPERCFSSLKSISLTLNHSNTSSSDCKSLLMSNCTDFCFWRQSGVLRGKFLGCCVVIHPILTPVRGHQLQITPELTSCMDLSIRPKTCLC
jgi:hypothetical protein